MNIVERLFSSVQHPSTIGRMPHTARRGCFPLAPLGVWNPTLDILPTLDLKCGDSFGYPFFIFIKICPFIHMAFSHQFLWLIGIF
jgi:hypothetical protein